MKTLTAIALLLCLVHSPARAERNEMYAGLRGGLMLPSYTSNSTSAFALASWDIGAQLAYGVLDDLYLTASFAFTSLNAQVDGYQTTNDGLDYQGILKFNTRLYHPDLGLKYKLYAGYNLAPYLEASVGYAFSTYNSPTMHNEDGQQYDFSIDDFSESALTVTGGVSVDYRLFNMIFAGVGVYFTYAFGDKILEYSMKIPVYVSYYW